MRCPTSSITRGYDVHVVFSDSEREAAQTLFERCHTFLEANKISYERDRFFSKPVGPWPIPMWQFVLPNSTHIHRDLGLCIAWFMLNRGEFSVMIHPNTDRKDGVGGAYEDHSQNHLWFGSPIALNMSIFESSSWPSRLYDGKFLVLIFKINCLSKKKLVVSLAPCDCEHVEWPSPRFFSDYTNGLLPSANML